jgi:hypothetical protein
MARFIICSLLAVYGANEFFLENKMNKEQISSLKEFIATKRKDDEMEIVEVFCLIDEWIEHNPHQFQPNWDDAPVGATRGINSTRWWNEKGEYIETTNSISFERPKPKVEAGQVWVNGGYVDDITQSVNIDYASDQVVVFSGHYTNGKQQHYSLADFLAKFEQAQ